MANRNNLDDAQDPNEQLLDLVRWASRERYEILRLHPFRVRTPSVNRRRGRRLRIPSRASEMITTPERMNESRRMAPQSHRLRVLELPRDVEFLQRIELDCQPKIPTTPPESPSRADDCIGQVRMSYLTLHFLRFVS
jgi:hypothetical protein